MAKKIDIIDLLPDDAVVEATKLGYKFLKELGYNVPNEDMLSWKEQKQIKEEMKRKNEYLRYKGSIDHESKKILVWYVLYREGKKIAQSQGITFILREGE
jgi:hypothetical protein